MPQRSAHELDMIHGPVLSKIILFNLPMALSNMLQLVFNAADVVVVGRFAGAEALAAVGSTTSLVYMLISFFVGISSGVNISIARDYGAGKYEQVSRSVHSAMTMAAFLGIAAGALGILLARPVLTVMGSPADVRALSVVYLNFYYTGMPALIAYNFGASILRSIGDTRRPMIYLITSGILNVILNLIFVIVFHMGVAGVGLATAISNYVSALLVILALLREDSCLKLIWRKLRLEREITCEILRLGLPAGLQGSLFGLSNVMIQSAINSFGPIYMAGNAAAQSLEGFLYSYLMSTMNTCLTFVSQNFGAHKFGRIRTIFWTTIWSGALIAIVLGVIFSLLRYPLLSLYNTDPAVLAVGARRLVLCTLPAFLEVPMDAQSATIRGYGRTFEPMVTSLLGAVGFRILWLHTVFRLFPYFEVIMIIWPASWIVIMIANYFLLRKIRSQYPLTDQD